MIRTIARKEIKLLLKEKGTFFWLLGMPIVFIVIFATVFSSASSAGLTLQYVDQDQSAASQQFLQTIQGIDGFHLKQNPDLTVDEQIDQMKNGKLSALLVFPKGFAESLKSGTKQAEVVLYHDGMSGSEVAPIQAVLQNIANQYQEKKLEGVLAAAGKSDAELKQVLTPPIKVAEQKQVSGGSVDMISQVVPGYTVMFAFFVITSMVRRFIKDKESGMTARLSSTPMKSISYLIGMWIPYLLVVVVQCSILLAFGHFVYHLNLGDLAAIGTLVFGIAICGTGLGLMISLFAKSENQGMAFTQLITMGGAVLGGLWFPSDMMPPFLQNIGKMLPQYWAQKGMQNVMVHGGHVQNILPNIGMLVLIAVLALGVASLGFRRFMKTAVH
ncbi:multidrug ABC transporter permease [Paenibacillus selenitireducens]|jgi:ABC-2 type transport system permease protein|uniref:Multidrug ABC transporter permease n=1 Tax=Paenibacillus selenitireducens TaxID=1324314 RepID=A0A1T2X8I2_9BACL|nr:ABC transporter permease [Paenibacillus selenitireducens]OPA76135.1 multidrug ABC transporter permease [Paenibacillus selenitireducens]